MRQKRRWLVAAGALVAVVAVSYFLRSGSKMDPARSAWLRGGSSSRAAAGPCVDFRDAIRHTGENGCVQGRVLRAYTSSRGNTFLDFCDDYRNCPFGSVI